MRPPTPVQICHPSPPCHMPAFRPYRHTVAESSTFRYPKHARRPTNGNTLIGTSTNLVKTTIFGPAFGLTKVDTGNLPAGAVSSCSTIYVFGNILNRSRLTQIQILPPLSIWRPSRTVLSATTNTDMGQSHTMSRICRRTRQRAVAVSEPKRSSFTREYGLGEAL